MRKEKDSLPRKTRTRDRIQWCILAVLIVCIAILTIVPANADESPSVIIRNYTVTPSVLMPGETGTLTVTISSTTTSTEQKSVTYGSDVASLTRSIIPYVESIILKSTDFKVLDGGSHFKGYVGPEQEIPVTFLIQAPPKNGIFFPEVWIRVSGGQSIRYPVPVNVNTQVSVIRTPSLSLDNTFNDQVKPGTRISGELFIANTGSSQADNVQVYIRGNPPSVIPAGINSLQIETLPPGKEIRQNITLLIDKNAPTGLIQVPVDLSYAVLDGTIIQQEGSIGLDIRGEAEIGVTSVETSPQRVEENSPFDLIIRVQNTGTGEAKTVDATTDLSFPGAEQAFIGRIKSGNDAPATFMIGGAPAGSYPYTVTITFTDDWGVHTLERDLNLTISGGDGSGIILSILILLIVAGAGAFWYYRKKNGEE